MYTGFEKWLNRIFEENPDIEGKGAAFNLYEEQDDRWSIQLVTTSRFDENDEDWICDEVFTSGEDLYTWQQDAGWEEILASSIDMVKKYLDTGKYAAKLKCFDAVAIGFVDGDAEILYLKQ